MFVPIKKLFINKFMFYHKKIKNRYMTYRSSVYAIVNLLKIDFQF